MFAAVIVDDEGGTSTDVRHALADAGCIDIEVASLDDAVAHLESGGRRSDLAVVNYLGRGTEHLQRLARVARDLPVVVLCEERHLEAVLRAGATQCVTVPVRPRELLGRIRTAIGDRAEVRQRSHRERRMSDTIVALQREKADLERLVCVDSLTGVANRRYALSLLDIEWRRSAREQSPLGLVMIDLDCYHAYNEHYGHLGGDACLQRVSDAMARCLRRPSDVLGRYGGEEFIAVLPNTDAVGAKIVAERLRAAAEALGIPHVGSTCAPVVTLTAGFASLRPTSDEAPDRLIALADEALLRAKVAGRNRIDGEAPIVPPSRVSAQRWLRFEPVLADPWLATRIPAFLSEAHRCVGAIMQGEGAEELSRIVRTTTMLKTSARELRLASLEGLVVDLEQAATAADVAAAREAADELIQYVTHVQVIYRRADDVGIPLGATTT